MKSQDILTQILIFLASISSTVYALFSNTPKELVTRTVFLIKILGGVIVAFFVMPAIMEYFNLSIRMTLLFTIIVAYGYESLLKASIKRIARTINKNENESDNNN